MSIPAPRDGPDPRARCARSFSRPLRFPAQAASGAMRLQRQRDRGWFWWWEKVGLPLTRPANSQPPSRPPPPACSPPTFRVEAWDSELTRGLIALPPTQGPTRQSDSPSLKGDQGFPESQHTADRAVCWRCMLASRARHAGCCTSAHVCSCLLMPAHVCCRWGGPARKAAVSAPQ